MGRKAINWNALSKDSNELRFWNQNVQQFWLPEDFSPARDKGTWDLLSTAEKEVYKKVLIKLTGLDTDQGAEGMPLIQLHMENPHFRSVLMFMGMMENVHAKSYSHIFQSLITDKEEEKALFDWQENHPILQRQSEMIVNYYRRLLAPEVPVRDLYMAMVASVFLESFLFYSGFFYPLYLAGQGKMVASGEIIAAIVRDESIHGVLVGYLAQQEYGKLTEEERKEIDQEFYSLLDALYALEVEYTKEVYSPIGLAHEVLEFLKYNANKALNNLGREEYYEVEEVNPIVLAGLDTETKNHDFFSTKGNSYIKSVHVKPVGDDDFASLEALLGKPIV